MIYSLICLGSNGHPSSPNSLHYYTSSSPTLYERAMQAVGSIIQDYDSDKQFPVLGFGAKIPPHGQLSHEFFVNLTSNPFCAGVEGINFSSVTIILLKINKGRRSTYLLIH